MDPTPPTNRSYSFSRPFRASIYLTIVIFWGMALGTLYLGIFSRPTPNPGAPSVIALALTFVLGGYYYLDILPRVYSRIVLNERQIVQEFKNGTSVSIAWGEIVRIRPRAFLNRIELHAAGPRRVIYIETQIQGFAEIVGFIREKMMGRNSKGPRAA